MSDSPHSLQFTHTLQPQVLEPELLEALWHDSASPPASEDACLAMIDAYFPSQTPHTPAGRGSDCAELVIPEHNRALALSTDFFWENSHFRTAYFTPYEVGAKALTVAISDLAGAGAQQLGYSLGLMLPPWLSSNTLHHIFAGMANVAQEYNVVLTGGDLSRGDTLGFCATVWGSSLALDGKTFFARQQAVPGDVIFLIGEAGLARVGLTMLEAEGRKAVGTYPAATQAHLAPIPRLNAARQLARFAFAQPQKLRMSLMDLSDGLARDLPRLVGSYGANLTFAPSLIHEELYLYARAYGENAEDLFLLGGEDFALLGTCDPVVWPRLSEQLEVCTQLGTVTDKPGIYRHGVPFKKSGFDHFSVTGEQQESAIHLSNTQGASPTSGLAPANAPVPASAEVASSSAESAPATTHAWGEALAAGMASMQHVCRQAWERGLLAGFNGNASLRLPAYPGQSASERESCLITRSGATKSMLSPEDFVLLAMDGKILQGSNPSSEAPMHLAVYAACPKAQAILHTHPPHLLALCMLLPPEKRLVIPLFEADAYRAQLGFTPAYPPGSAKLATAVAEAAASHKAVWLENHGLMVHGPTLGAALGLMEELEQLARIQLLSLQKEKEE